MPNPRLRKLVIEFRYPAKLSFYGKMDEVGMTLSDEFPDWRRSSLSLEVVNKKKHQRVFLGFQKCFIEIDTASETPSVESDFAKDRIVSVCFRLGLEEISRIGMRQWFTIDIGKSFARTVDLLHEKLFDPPQKLKSILSDSVKDVAYAVDYKTTDGWEYNLRLGPMTAKEWFERVPYEGNSFEAESRNEEDGEDRQTFQNYQGSLPSEFVYFDIDCYEQSVAVGDIPNLLTTFKQKATEVLNQTHAYILD